MARKRPPDTPGTVTHRPGSAWSQQDLGEAFDVDIRSVIGELDPTGSRGVVEEVLSMFSESLEPMLSKLEHLRAAGSASGILFEAHMLKSAAGQIAALRLSAACAAIVKHFKAGASTQAEPVDGELDALVDNLVSETIRVQRELKRLLLVP